MQTDIVFIGGGNMATSLIGGLVANGHPCERIRVVDPDPARQNAVQRQFGVSCCATASADFLAVDVWVLAVKPQIMSDVVTPLRALLPTTPPLVISIAAGVPCSALQRWLGGEIPLVRCMPNTPALIGAGTSGLFASHTVSAEQKDMAQTILASAGHTAWVDAESMLDAVTATSGSGPAYFFAFMEAMQASAQALGLPEATARELVLHTALGAARLALEGDDDPATLRRKVTSPGGTTERALRILEEGGFDLLVDEAMHSAAIRSAELARELG